MSVLLNDRYLNPAISARSLLDEKRQSMAVPSSISAQMQPKQSRAGRELMLTTAAMGREEQKANSRALRNSNRREE